MTGLELVDTLGPAHTLTDYEREVSAALGAASLAASRLWLPVGTYALSITREITVQGWPGSLSGFVTRYRLTRDYGYDHGECRGWVGTLNGVTLRVVESGHPFLPEPDRDSAGAWAEERAES